MNYIFYWYNNLNDMQKTIVAALILIISCSGLALLKGLNYF